MDIEQQAAIAWADSQRKFLEKEKPDYENESTVVCAFNEGFEACQAFFTPRLSLAIKERDEALDKLEAMESQAKSLITKACCSAVEILNEIAPDKGWDSGEVVAEMYIRQLSIPAEKPAVAVPDGYKLMPEQITEEMADAYWHEYQKESGSHLGRCYDALYEAAPSLSQQSARSPQDYAIEHAEYMAVNAESLMEYLNEISNVDDGTLEPDDRLSDYVGALRCGIHDFRKRRDRCKGEGK